MSGPEETLARRPLRTIGLALLGLAVVAALIGLLAVPTGDGTLSATDQPAAPSSSAGPAPGGASASSSPVVPPVTTIPAPATSAPAGPVPAPGVLPGTSVPPAATPPGPADPDVVAGGKALSRGETRVYNNSTVRGLAAQAASDLSAAGWTVVEVDNYSAGRIPTTTVYYQEGTDQRTIAEAIGARFGMRVEPRFPGIVNARPGVIVIVTNDYGS